jgi:hypothetical protein
MIDAKMAVRYVQKYISDIFEGTMISRLTIEEIELSEDERHWFITMGFPINLLIGSKEYKIFKVNAESGIVESMKIRRS